MNICFAPSERHLKSTKIKGQQEAWIHGVIFQWKEKNAKEAKIKVFLTMMSTVKEIKRSHSIMSDKGDKLLSLSCSEKASWERAWQSEGNEVTSERSEGSMV